jgi:hypothetical protein
MEAIAILQTATFAYKNIFFSTWSVRFTLVWLPSFFRLSFTILSLYSLSI